MVDCVHPGSIITPGNFKFSLEPSSRCDPATNVLGYVPVATADEIKRSPKGPRGQYGLGTGGVEWYCMICIQRMFDILDRQGLLSRLKGYHNGFQPLFAVAYWIEAETRTLPEYLGLFRPNLLLRMLSKSGKLSNCTIRVSCMAQTVSPRHLMIGRIFHIGGRYGVDTSHPRKSESKPIL